MDSLTSFSSTTSNSSTSSPAPFSAYLDHNGATQVGFARTFITAFLNCSFSRIISLYISGSFETSLSAISISETPVSTSARSAIAPMRLKTDRKSVGDGVKAELKDAASATFASPLSALISSAR
ncbi:hypothetical protein D3C84_962460 [compost metagenome]